VGELVLRDVHGITLEIACADHEIAELVARRLAAFPVGAGDVDARVEIDDAGTRRVPQPPPGARVVHEAPRGSVLYSDEQDALWIAYEGVSAHCLPSRGEARIDVDRTRTGWQWAATRPVLTLTLIELLKRHSLFALHAAAAARQDDAVLFVGHSGSGKSTSALALLLDGWQLLGDDMIFLRGGARALEALGFPDEIDATVETVRLLPQLAPIERWPVLPGYTKHQLPPAALRPDAVALSATPRLVLVPRVSERTHPALEPLTPDELLLELLPNVILTEAAAAQQQLDVLAELARTVPSFRLALPGDVRTLGGEVEEALRRA